MEVQESPIIEVLKQFEPWNSTGYFRTWAKIVEAVTQGYLEEELEVLVVGDDAVVDDDELVVLAGGVRVGVDRGRNTVGGPPSEQKLFSKSAPVMLVLPQAA